MEINYCECELTVNLEFYVMAFHDLIFMFNHPRNLTTYCPYGTPCTI